MKELAEVSGQGALGVSSCPHPPHPSSVDKLHGSHVEKFSGNRVLFPTSLNEKSQKESPGVIGVSVYRQKEINLELSLKGLMLKLQYFSHLMQRVD